MPSTTNERACAAAASQPMIEARGIHKTFGRVPVLRNVSLTVGQGEVVALIEFEEFSYADAAAIIGCPVGTVRSRLNRAKEALRQRIVELFPADTRISA